MDLNALASDDEGAQAQAGITGLGLPSLDVQWVSGAGDGAQYRGKRVLPRDIDVPIEFMATSRAGLVSQLDQLSRILAADDCKLRLIDSELGTNFYTSVHRVGGGDYITGQDTNGIHNMRLVITLRAGDPYWIAESGVEVQQTDGAGIGPTMALNNPGTANAYPVWTIDGPGYQPTLTSPDGEVLQWSDFIPHGGKLIIDTYAGTVVDETGNSRYSSLSAAPRFFKLKPGAQSVGVSLDRSSAEFTSLATAGLLNHVPNPALLNDSVGYTLTAATRDATAKYLKTTKGYIESSPVDTNPATDPTPIEQRGFNLCNIAFTITGLTPGTPVELSFDYAELDKTSTPIVAATHGGSVSNTAAKPPIARIEHVGAPGSTEFYSVPVDPVNNYTGTFSYTFTPATDSVTITLMPSRKVYSENAGSSNYSRGVWFISMSFDNFYVGPPGQGYFSGDTADGGGWDYSWLGTANASKSKKLSTSATDTTTAKVTCDFKPRKWMVV